MTRAFPFMPDLAYEQAVARPIIDNCISRRPYLALSASRLANEAALYQGLGHATLIALHRRRNKDNGEARSGKLVVDLNSVHREPDACEAAVRPNAGCILQGEAGGSGHQDFFGGVVHYADLHCCNGHSDVDCIPKAIVC